MRGDKRSFICSFFSTARRTNQEAPPQLSGFWVRRYGRRRGLRNSLRSDSPRPFSSVFLATSPPDKGGIGGSSLYSNPLALWALPLYSLTETQRERFKSGISCFGIRIDFILLALRVLSLSYLWWAEGEAEFYRKSIQLLFNHSPKRLECGCR